MFNLKSEIKQNISVVVEDLIEQDGMVRDVEERVNRNNMKIAARNAFAGNAVYYSG